MTGPRIGVNDEFEGLYIEKFRSLARPFGEFVKYERDRAAIDIGIHLTQAAEEVGKVAKTVSNTRIGSNSKESVPRHYHLKRSLTPPIFP